MNTQEALLESGLECDSSFAYRALEAVRAGVERLRQQAYADLDSEIAALSGTNAEPLAGPEKKTALGKLLNGDEVYIQEIKDEAPKLLIESSYPNKKVETTYWVAPFEGSHELAGFKREVHTYDDDDTMNETTNEKLDIVTARRIKRIIRKMNQRQHRAHI